MVPVAPRAEGAGEALELRSIHESHADFVWQSLQRLGVRSEDLEDALQEVFVVVHRKLHTFDGSARLTTWLFGISLRVASAFRRKAHRWRERPVFDLDEAAGASSGNGPEAVLLEAEARERLARVLDELEPERRVIFVMFEIESIPCPEIAVQLGLPLGTVYSRLGAARMDFSKAAVRWQRRDAARTPR